MNYENINTTILLFPNGEIHGKYRLGTDKPVEMHGYLDEAGRMYVILGKGTQNSFWTQFPQHSEDDSKFEYSGQWGNKNIPTHMTYQITR